MTEEIPFHCINLMLPSLFSIVLNDFLDIAIFVQLFFVITLNFIILLSFYDVIFWDHFLLSFFSICDISGSVIFFVIFFYSHCCHRFLLSFFVFFIFVLIFNVTIVSIFFLIFCYFYSFYFSWKHNSRLI